MYIYIYISRDGLDVAQDIVDVARVWVMFLLSLGCRLPCYALRISLNVYLAICIYIYYLISFCIFSYYPIVLHIFLYYPMHSYGILTGNPKTVGGDGEVGTVSIETETCLDMGSY